MTGAKVRLYNPEWTNLTTTKAHVTKKDVHGKYPLMFEIHYKGTGGNAAELGGAADSAKDGTTTPFLLIVVSNQADDTDSAIKDVRAIAVIGITVASLKNYVAGKEKPVYSVEEFRMNGTTDVTSTRYYLHVIHGYAIEWGSAGADAKGNITLEAPANTTLHTIAATYNESNGCKIWGTNEHVGRWKLLDLTMYDLAFNNA